MKFLIAAGLFCFVITNSFANQFTLSFGSCSKHNKEQPLWRPILSFTPDVFMWTGDVVYADTKTDKTKLARYLTLQKQRDDYQKVLAKTEVIGTWDDHDFGQNNAGKDFPLKEINKQAFLDFLDVPKDHPRRQRQGVYATHTYKKGNLVVQIILLDVRYNREDPAENADPLGAEQWQWLEQQLQTKVKGAHMQVLVSGIQFLPEDHRFEKWANFPKARARILKLIDHSPATGVLLVSGDRHMGEISAVHLQERAERLIEITSSGMTHAWGRYSEEVNRHRIAGIYPFLNFGLIQFELQKDHVRAEISVVDQEANKKLKVNHLFKLK